MAFKKNTFAGSRSFIIVIASVLLLILAGIIGWNLFKYKFIKGRVKSAVYEKTNGLYTIRYDKMDLDEVGGYLHVTNLQIIPDTVKYKQMVADKRNPPLLLSLYVPELTIAGVKTPKAMAHRDRSWRRPALHLRQRHQALSGRPGALHTGTSRLPQTQALNFTPMARTLRRLSTTEFARSQQ